MRLVLVAATLLVAMAAAQLQSTFGNDKNLQQYLSNPALVQKQIGCVLGQGGCDDLGNRLRAVIPEVLNNNCRKCTPQQANNARALVSFLQKNHPQALEAIIKRYRG